MPNWSNFKDLFGNNPKTTIFGCVAIVCAGVALCLGKLDFNQFLMTLSVIGAGGGLIAAKDSKKE